MSSPERLAGRVAQLRTLAKARTATEFARAAPGWLTDQSRQGEAAAAAVLRLIDAVPDPLYRAAARELFPLPYDSSPGSFSERRVHAARHFGVSVSTFRTGTPTRPSYEERVLGAIVEAADPPAPTRSGRSRLVALAVAAALVLLIGVAVVSRSGTDGADSSVSRRQGGELPDQPLPNPPDRPISFAPDDPGRQATDDLPPDVLAPRVCPGRTLSVTPQRQLRVSRRLQQLGLDPYVCQDTSPADRWDMTVVKYLTGGTASDWVDIEFPGGSFLVVPREAWSSYRSMRESSVGEQVGRPTRWDIDKMGRSELHVEDQATVVGARWWLPHYAVVEPFLTRWLTDRESLGDPMADATPLGLTLERGRLWLSDSGIVLTRQSVESSRSALPSDDQLRNSVLGQEAGPHWFVDASFERWWIPNETVLKCLTENRAVHHNRPAAQVASLPLAGIASCEFAPLGQ